MPSEQRVMNDIREFINVWMLEISMANALDYYDINKSSEQTCLKLLNLIYKYALKDLNREKVNFPGIDLGCVNAGVAFQITTRMDTAKIVHSLDLFIKHEQYQRFPNGIRFLLLRTGRKTRILSSKYMKYAHVFNPECDVLYANDLVREIGTIYSQDSKRFWDIYEFLHEEFGYVIDNKRQSGISKKDVKTNMDKIDHYREIFNITYQQLLVNFLPINIRTNDIEVNSEEIIIKNNTLITGESGHGKSLLAKKLALSHSQSGGLSLYVEAKEYSIGLDSLLTEESKRMAFPSGASFFNLLCRNEYCFTYRN